MTLLSCALLSAACSGPSATPNASATLANRTAPVDAPASQPATVAKPPLLVAVRADRTVVGIAPDGTQHPMAAGRPVAGGNGTLGVGSDDPVLSPDGRYLAYIADGELFVESTDGSGARKAAGLPPSDHDAIPVLLSTWTADSRSLIFGVEGERWEQGCERAPCGLAPSFYMWTTTDDSYRALPGLAGVSASSPRPDCVLHAADQGLFEYCMADSAIVTRQLMSSNGAMGQLMRSGDRLAWNLNNFLQHTRLGGTGVHLIVVGGWAEFQWPQLSPDAKHLMFLARIGEDNGRPVTEWRVSAIDSGLVRFTIQCGARLCNARWSRTGDILLQDPVGLLRVDLDGTRTRILEKASFVALTTP